MVLARPFQNGVGKHLAELVAETRVVGWLGHMSQSALRPAPQWKDAAAK
jgi:hypothetical protein